MLTINALIELVENIKIYLSSIVQRIFDHMFQDSGVISQKYKLYRSCAFIYPCNRNLQKKNGELGGEKRERES